MLWGLFKRLVFYAMIIFLVTTAMTYFAPKAFEDNTLKRCSSKDHGFGICAGRTLEKGDSIGLIFTKGKEGQVKYTEVGQSINKAGKSGVEANMMLQPLFLEDGRVDMYGYAMRGIEEGEEVFIA